MTTTNRGRSAREIVDDVLGRAMTREVWSANYEKALPVTVHDFDLSAVLSSVFFMFGFGYRRGKGNFLEIFGDSRGTPKERRKAATIERVSTKLASSQAFQGFNGGAEQAILGDMLLSYCLENNRRALGRQEQIQRTAPSHYMASWIDLPERVTNLRYVPEMIVAMLADQDGNYVEADQEEGKSWFGIGRRAFDNNMLLRAFNQGIVRSEGPVGRHSDQFRENSKVGLDQLLMIRLAQQLGAAPDKARGAETDRISNQRPIAQKAAQEFSDDIRRFVRAYADVIPRHAFVELLESCMATGLTAIVTSVIELLFDWANTGAIRQKGDHYPTPLFVDCSNGVDRRLRSLAEQSMDDFMRRIESVPTILMVMRLLDYGVRHDRRLRGQEVPTRPYATDWLNLLGDVLHERHEDATPLLDYFDRKAEELADQLQGEDYPEVAETLRDHRTQENPVWRMAEALTFLQGRKNTQGHVINLVDSSLMTDRPNGIAARRSVTRRVAGGGTARRRDLRSLVFTDSVMDYLVHLLVLPSGDKPGQRDLSFNRFIETIRYQYGFFLDQAPRGLSISNELLQVNRVILERRLRDLGLLIGVNDAESMKRLRGRFEQSKES